MQMIFATHFASEIAAVAEDGGDALLRERVAALDEDQCERGSFCVRRWTRSPSTRAVRRRTHQPAPKLQRERDQETGQKHPEKEELDGQPGRAVRSPSTEAKREEQRHGTQHKPAATERAKCPDPSSDSRIQA